MFPAQPNKSLIDGLACLQSLAAAGGPIGGRELAQSLGLEVTRVNRLLKTLGALGFARQNRQRKYIAGPAMHVLAAQSAKGSRLLACAMPAIRRLQAEGLTVALGVLWRTHVCYLFHAKPTQQLVEGVFHHELYPALQSGIGLSILAPQTDAEITELFETSPTDSPQVLNEEARSRLKATRESGFCYLPRRNGDASLGVAIGNPAVAGLAFAGHFPATDVPRLAQLLREVAEEIATALQSETA